MNITDSAVALRAYNRDFSVNRIANAKRDIHRNSLDLKPRGKGSRAWKRVAALERAFRASGGFYLADLIRGV